MGSVADVQDMIRGHLPSWDRAIVLSHNFFEQGTAVFRPMTRSQVLEDMLPGIYRRDVGEANEGDVDSEEYNGPHDLALMFIIFAVSTLVEADSSDALAEHYYQIARAALCLQPILEKPSMVTVQTLYLLSIYTGMSAGGNETSMEMTWSLVTLSAHLSQTVGVHCVYR